MKKSELRKLIKEELSNTENVPYRIDGLIDIKDYNTFKRVVKDIIHDLTDIEPFETSDVKAFLIDFIEKE